MGGGKNGFASSVGVHRIRSCVSLVLGYSQTKGSLALVAKGDKKVSVLCMYVDQE